MKNKILFLSLLLFSVVFVHAQGGGFQRRTVEERVKVVHDKLDSAFKLEPAKMKESDDIFTTYYKAMDKLREEMMSGGERPDPQVMREKMQPITNERDEKLKKVLTEDQYKKWKEEIEPSMRPQRGPRQ
jgi:ribosomal protein L14E/L6E/L27E